MAPPPLLQFLLLLLLCCDLQLCAAANVSYDHRALVVDGSRRVLISGSIHYPRSTPEMWPDLIDKSKDGGLDVIETYVFWNLHEPVQGQYDFEGRKDLVRFVKTVASAGLYVHLRIGPYVCAEWNYGGFPVWLHFIPGIKFRTDNEPFKREMQRFTAKIVDMMKQEKLYASQGGPIILSQIENEYGNVDEHYGPAAKTYINWSASMATSLDTGVPWVMCQQSDAPDPIINTCNGFYCDQFTPNSNQKPKIWTENWSGWFLDFGGRVPYRPVEDLAFSVARFFQRGGTFQNYYMYHGGTNFGRSSGGPFISTSYDYDAPIDEYGIVRQPKWGHLRDLHKAIKLCEKALIATDPTYTSLGPNLEAHVYKTSSGTCAAFLANVNSNSDAIVTFYGKTYHLAAWSVSVLPDCENVVFNTAQIISQATLSETKYVKTYSQESDQPIFTSEITESGWKYVQEPVGISKTSAFKREGLLEQINTTGDVSDYLWYSISVNITGNEPFLFNETQSILHVESLGHVLHAFVNGQSTGSGIGNSDNVNVFLETTVSLVPGKNIIDLLSVTVGLQNYGPFFDLSGAGVTGPVLLKGQSGRIDLSSNLWTYQIGLRGEDLGLSDSSIWISQDVLPKNSPLIWYMTDFDAPAGNDPVAIEFTGMRKGMAWVNGESIGRYWPAYLAPQTGCSLCNYRGAYSSDKCLKNCGKPSQTLYHVPRSFIQPGKNKLILFEEMGGDPTKISFTTRQTTSLCGYISESHPAPVDAWNTAKNQVPVLHLECPYSRQVISSVKFASFGTPSGTCGRYEHGKCRGSSALAIVQEACVGAKSCDVEVSTKLFGDPCANVSKSLAVEAACS
ncbi:beta-galactosidase 6-like isoform X1 [Zingiber officinale]|uniref:beta-galactosidase 6-like isoform X1 n=2 Tax=Zingiber officinale TaxID=94328 RepID=UPI001C4B6DC0|nr:beta-galactosidase 6-like isoform X1 [Zingiber officinale]